MYKASCLGLAVANQNAALDFAFHCVYMCIRTCSNVQPARDNIAVKSRASTAAFPPAARGLGAGNETTVPLSFQDPTLAGGRVWERDYGPEDFSCRPSGPGVGAKALASSMDLDWVVAE